MILKFGVKHGYLDYKEWEIRFPTEDEKQHLEVLSISHQKKDHEFYPRTFHIQEFRNLYLP